MEKALLRHAGYEDVTANPASAKTRASIVKLYFTLFTSHIS
jgi:hypothetical protein